MSARIAILVGLARHPRSGRTVANPADVAAVERALALGGSVVEPVHAGPDPDVPALRDVLGHGAATLTVLRTPPGADVLDPLVDHLSATAPDLILAGAFGGSGAGSGMLPHRIAARLDRPCVAAVRSLRRDGDGWAVEQAADPGTVRRLRVSGPLVAILPPDAAPTGYPVFATARRGRITTVAIEGGAMDGTVFRPARARPRPIDPVRGATAVERLARIHDAPTGGGRVLVGATPAEAAREILAEIRRSGFGREGDR